MKYLLLIIGFSCLSALSFGQEKNKDHEKKKQEIEALKIAFISKELSLTPEEAQKFWPVYNLYFKELRATVGKDDSVIDKEEKILNVRKKYKSQFSGIIGAERMDKLFKSEGKFRQLLLRSMKDKQHHGADRREEGEHSKRPHPKDKNEQNQ